MFFLQHIVTDLLNRKINDVTNFKLFHVTFMCHVIFHSNDVEYFEFMHFANLEVYKLVYKNEFDIPMDLTQYKI